jgi:multidrug efflux pump subunit AcrA (membrane-fusion protein)
MDGRIVGTPPQLGEMLLPGGVNVLSLVDFGSLVVEVDVPEARLALVKPGAPCEIVLDAFPDTRRRGKVKEITPRVNRSKATVVVKAEFVDVPELVLPEMAARVAFLQKALDAAAMKEPPKNVVPGAAVTERAGRKVVFVVDGNRVRLEPVTLGPAIGDGFELKEGPAPGTKLVRNPPPVLEDGKSIKERTEG